MSPCLEDVQLRGLGRLGKGSRNTGTGGIVGEAVKGTDEKAVAHASAHVGSQGRAQVRTYRPGDANGSLVVAPDDNVLTKPLLLYQLLLRNGATVSNEIPPLGKRMESRLTANHVALVGRVVPDVLQDVKLLHGGLSQAGMRVGSGSLSANPTHVVPDSSESYPSL